MDKKDSLQTDIDLNAMMNDLLPTGLPPGWLNKQLKSIDRYFRRPTKVLRKRSEVLAQRNRQKVSRRINRGSVRGQKNHKGLRNRRAAT